MGALTFTVQNRGIAGNMRYAVVDVLFSASYATGGDTGMTAAGLGFTTIYLVLFGQDDGYTFRYDYTNGTLFAYRIDVVAGAGVADGNNTIIKSATDTLEVAGTGTAFQVALGEVSNAVDLSTTPGTVRCLVFGV